MKNPFNLRALLALAAVLAMPAAIHAQSITKVDDTNSLNQGVSWVGGTAPGSGNIASWSGVYSGGPATGVVTNSLYAIFDGSTTPSWGGISVGALTGSCLTQSPIFNVVGSVSNLTAASESVVNGFNLVTITCNASHRFEPGEAITISGVTPAGYNGTYPIDSVPSATTFTYTNATGSLTAGTAFGTASGNLYIGGSGTAGASLTIGTSGITIASGAPGVVVNDITNEFNGNQSWNLAPGTLLRFSNGGGAATARVLSSGNDGTIEISGGGVASLNEGGGSTFDDPNSFAPFTGNWQVDSGSTMRGLRDGASAFGSGSITLNGGTLAVGGMSGDVGNWTWNTPITLNSGTTSYIADENVTGTGRYLLLQDSIAGSGNLVFNAPLVTTESLTTADLGFIVAGGNTMTGTVTIGGPVENGVPGRLSYVRVGAPASGVGADGAGNSGSLGTGNIVDNGVLTFTYEEGVTIPNVISGTGTLRIGSSTYIGTAYQAITLTGANTYTGPTIINAGTLLLASGASIANSSSISITTNTVNSGAVINTFDVSQLAGGFTTAPGQTLSLNGGNLNGSFNFAAGSTNVLAPGGSNVVGTLNISGNLTLSGGNNTFVLDINNSANDQVNISGNLTASGVTTLQFVPPGLGLSSGSYTLINVGGTLSATPANFSIAGLVSGGRSQTFSIVINGSSVQLVVVGSPGNLTWVGNKANNVWNTEITTNWYNNGTSALDYFYSGDLVTFDDTAVGTTNVTLVGSLSPSSITLNNNANSYTFGGSGQIAGGGTLSLSGSGMLTINTSNSFTGGVVLNSGTLAITNESALGEPVIPTVGSLTLNGGMLLITNTLTMGANTNRGILVTASGGGFIVTNGSTVTVSNVIGDTTGTGILDENGNGTLILDGNNNYGGGTIVNGGTVVSGNSHGLGLNGNWSPGFTLQQGIVDVDGQGNYSNASLAVSNNYLFNGVFITFAGNAGATMQLIDSVPGSAGFGVNGTASVNDVITYNGANNPGQAIISAPWYAVGTGSAVRTCVVEVDPTTATNVGLQFVGQMSSLSYEGKVAIIQKTGNGVMEISSTNYYPNMQVTAGTLLVNNTYALGADRSPSYEGQSAGSPHQLIVDGGTVDLNGFSPAIGALSDNGGITSGVILDNGGSASTLMLGYSASNEVNDASYAGTIANGTSAVAIVKIGTNTQALAGIDTYSGPTIVNNGALLVNAPGQIGLGAPGSLVSVAGGTLGGSGTINAPVIVQSGGTLAPGAGAASTVTLTITTNLTLDGTNIMNVDTDTATNDLVVLTGGTINYGGTLVVSTNLIQSTTLVLGDSFKLFSAPAHTGNFSSISGAPGAGLAWSFNPASGVLSVANPAAPQPGITGISLSGTSLVINGTNGVAGESYNVLTTTNLALPLSQWTVLPTNTFSAGSFSLTNTVNSGVPQSFYMLRVP